MLLTNEDEWSEAQHPLSQRRTTEAARYIFRPGTVELARQVGSFLVTADSKGLKSGPVDILGEESDASSGRGG